MGGKNSRVLAGAKAQSALARFRLDAFGIPPRATRFQLHGADDTLHVIESLQSILS